jgi:uroporphyrinogen-III synthase
MSSPPHRIPVVLLKTKSTPGDSYEECFSSEPFTPTFVPVLEHRPNVQNLDFIRSLLLGGKLGRDHNAKYGGMIFTSQRAVEGFARVVDEVEVNRSVRGDESEFMYSLYSNTHASSSGSLCSWLTSWSDQDPDALGPNNTSILSTAPLPLYVVGPATFRILTSVLSMSSCSYYSVLVPLNPQIFGSHTGNGEALAHYILDHYHSLPGPYHTLPLLFLVGEQRRDIIPKTLMDPSLPENKQIHVDELVVYETGVMESFARDFGSLISQIESDVRNGIAVVVVFSPSGCEAMLRCLGYIDNENKLTDRGKSRSNETNEVKEQPDTRTRYIIATIGPTTRDYLRREFGFEADVCAEKPGPEGVVEGVKKFLTATANPRA